MYPRIAQFKTAQQLTERASALGLTLALDDRALSAEEGSPLAQPIEFAGRLVGNRWCVQPMEGWDASANGEPSEHTFRRWRRFGESGAKLIWGGEAAAVRSDGRANPNQLLATPAHQAGLAQLLTELKQAHISAHGRDDNLVAGLQLTHSGRFAKPGGHGFTPRSACANPLVDPILQSRFGQSVNAPNYWTDDELSALQDDYVAAARTAEAAGFDFVDIKACHGYLLHELLGAAERPGCYGGDFAGRTRLLLNLIERIGAECRGLAIGVRLSAYDSVPFEATNDGGRPVAYQAALPYRAGFGADPNDPLRWDCAEPLALCQLLEKRGVAAVNVTIGCAYYAPHLLRPAMFPPSDGYAPPEDPLAGVCRHLNITRQLQHALVSSCPRLVVVGSGYSYLQEYVPHAAQAAVRAGDCDFVGLGRMMLAYPRLPADVLAGRPLERKSVCRTFSDCTTGPRAGMLSGCFPLDPYYKAMPEATRVQSMRPKAV